MQYFLVIFCAASYMSGSCAGYRRFYNTPVKENWTPLTPPVEEVHYSVVASSLSQGGGLYWDSAEKVLYFVDVTGQILYRYDPVTQAQKTIKFGTPVSLVIPMKDQRHRTVVALGSEMVILRWYWDSGNFSTSHLYSVDSQTTTSPWSTGKADALGRIWAETAGLNIDKRDVQSAPTLYKVDTVKSCRVDAEVSEDGVSTGLAWSLDNKVLYYSSPTRKIEAFDFYLDQGSVSNRRTIFDFGDVPGSPAGITIDSNGNLWIACQGGSQVIQVNPTSGQLLRQIKLPVKNVTSLVFGGPNFEDLYVTSASSGEGEGSLEGSVLKITDLQAIGAPMYHADVKCNPCNDKIAADSANWWCQSS